MHCLEIIKTVADIAIAIFTAALVWATRVLAKHTKTMSDRDSERLRIQDINKCIALAQSIVKFDVKEFGNWPTEGLSDSSIRPFNELLTLSKYLHDADAKRFLEYISSVLTVGLFEQSTNTFTNSQFTETLTKLRQKLTQEIIELQRDLGNYAR